MIQYLDTSLLVSAFTKEAATPRVQAWLAIRDFETFTISDWVVAEFSAALSVKLRVGTIELEERAEALSAFKDMSDLSLRTLPIVSAQFRTAARLADQSSLGLKAGDALHLAIAFDYGATLCTLDQRLAEAAQTLGVRSELL